jgi:hypothetical protein
LRHRHPADFVTPIPEPKKRKRAEAQRMGLVFGGGFTEGDRTVRSTLSAALANNPKLKRSIWESLQAITVDMLVDEGRVYGGGLYKLEPNELGNLPVTGFFDWRDEVLAEFPVQQPLL